VDSLGAAPQLTPTAFSTRTRRPGRKTRPGSVPRGRHITLRTHVVRALPRGLSIQWAHVRRGLVPPVLSTSTPGSPTSFAPRRAQARATGGSAAWSSPGRTDHHDVGAIMAPSRTLRQGPCSAKTMWAVQASRQRGGHPSWRGSAGRLQGGCRPPLPPGESSRLCRRSRPAAFHG